MEAEVALHEVGDLTRLQREEAGLELRHHLALLEDAEIAAARLAARILRVLVGHRGEVAGVDLLANALGLLARGLDLGGLGRLLVRHDQDVARGEQVAGVVVLFVARGIERRLRGGDGREELLELDLRDLRPHAVVDQLLVVQRVAVRGGFTEQLVVDPDVGDGERDVLAGRRVRGSHHLREALHRQLLAAGTRNRVDVRGQRVFQP